MRHLLLVLPAVLLGAGACSERGGDSQAAVAAFTEFQEALFAGDRCRLRRTKAISMPSNGR